MEEKKIIDKTPKYRVEYYKDDYNSLHQAIQIDLEEEKKCNGVSTTFYRSKINPNLTHHYRNLILNKYYQVLDDYKLEEKKQCEICGEWFDEDELQDTTEMINGGCGYCCEQCIEDGNMVEI